MGRRPLPQEYKGQVYRSVGWALYDVLLDHPLASDQRLAEILDRAASAIQYWRTKAGIPQFRVRDPENPYLKAKK